jgi:aldehyde:ferredoxin oxidoreductase
MHKLDPLSRVLTIDLSHRTHSVEDRSDLFDESLGGSGVAIRLLEEACPQGADPLGEENPIVLAVGPLVGHFPLASKTVAMFKSPHTGNLGESHAGGRSAVAIRMAGYGAVVVVGRSRTPVYVVIEDDGVRFRDASALWGLKSSYTVGTVLREREHHSGHRSILRIGPAGEKQISYACVITETYRHFGRLGLGAVFGSKNLKGLVVTGSRTLPVADSALYRSQYDGLFDAATGSSLMQKYHDLGTPVNVLPLNELGALPTRNLSQARFEAADHVSGENMAEQYLGRRLACAHCPVACIHVAALRTPHPVEPYFYKTSMLGYDYEPIYALGTMLGMRDSAGMLRLMDEVEIQGLDAMSTGVCLAWATEAMERGLITLDDTGGLALSWGEHDRYIRAVRKLVSQPTDFYRALARGVSHAASVYGGESFALAFGRNEMPGYHTGPAGYLGFLVGSRHSHLDNAGYSLDQKLLAQGISMTPRDMLAEILREERWRQVLSSLVICFFARNLYTPAVISGALASVGFAVEEDQLMGMGADTLMRKYRFKLREGFDPTAQPIPERIHTTPSPSGPISLTELQEALETFHRQMTS